MKINNRRYLGNKYKLLDFITETVKQNCDGVNSVFDVFAGTGSVSSAFTDKKLITNDILYSNYLTHICWFSNEQYNKALINKLIDRYNKCKPKKENYMSENFSDTFFSHDVCLKIGYIREDIESQYKKKIINDKEKAMLITSLLYACDKIANTVGHYDAYRIGAEYNNDFVMSFPEQFDLKKDNECYCEDSNKLAERITCDLAYLDPPYNSRQYSDAYHLLENIARWEKPEVVGVAKKMDRKKLKSDYCTVKATDAFEDLIHKLNCKYILLSYNNTSDKANGRSNAKITDNDIMRILSSRGKVQVFSKSYKAFTTGKSDNDSNEERLFLCTVDNTVIQSPLNYTGGKAKLFNQLRPLFPKHINTFVDLMCGGCNVGVNIKASKHIYNDSNSNLIGLFKIFQDTDINTFIADLEKYIKEFNLSESDKNGYEFYHANSNDGLAEYNRQHYLNLRDNFNSLKTKNLEYYEKLYLLIVYAFNNQIRFNSKGEFNLPVGKRDFNNSIRNKLITFSNKIKEQDAKFLNLSFLDFNEDLNKDDYVYIDPPYLITTASYNENSGWTPNDERNLLDYLAGLDKKKIKFGLSNVLKHKGRENNILIDWISEHGFVVHHLNKNYNNSNYQSKNTDKETDEVLITNY